MQEFLWVERYRPRTVESTVLPNSIKKLLEAYVKAGEIPNMILSGASGTGKTTAAKAMVEQLGLDYIVINGSLDMGVDKLRTDVQDFASTMSFVGGRKYVIVDEADGMRADVQKGFRNFIEEFSANCGFIFTCNYPNKIIDALRSRLPIIDFKIEKADRPGVAKQMFDAVQVILNAEKVEYDRAVLGELIKKFFPDWRRLIGELQKYSVTGKIDTGILSSFNDENIKALYGFMKDKNFTEVRKWVAENAEISQTEVFGRLWAVGSQTITKESLPKLVLVLADYQYKAAFVADPEINITAALVEIMASCKFV